MRRLGLVALATSCTGIIGNTSNPPDPDGPRNLCAEAGADVAGPRLLRRLTSGELDASVRAAFGLGNLEWSGPAVPADAAGRNGFTNNVDRLVVDEAYARGLRATAEAVADAVIDPLTLPRVLPCADAGGETCAQTFLDTVGRRLYRRPLTDEERGRYLALLDRVREADDFVDWVRWATVAMLQSPHFVYRSELGAPDGGAYRLTGYEVATALAFGLTGGPPDDELLDRAAAGGLDDAAGIEAAARALAGGPGLRGVMMRFFDQWLGLSALSNVVKDGAVHPAFTPEVRASMRAETEAFVDNIVFTDAGGVSELLTSPDTFVDATLAGYYGWGTPGAASTRPEGWGVGLLAQGSLLTINAGNVYTSPTQRGLLVRERLLCTDMPPPPPVVGDIPAPTGNETTRDRYEAHAAPGCYECHRLMDPMGFTFEHLDAAGRYRETEGTFPIDDTGFVAADGEELPVAGPADLAEVLASTPEVGTCVAAFMASHAYGLDHHDTSCLVTTPAEALASGELSLLDYYVGLTTTRHFRERTD